MVKIQKSGTAIKINESFLMELRPESFQDVCVLHISWTSTILFFLYKSL